MMLKVRLKRVDQSKMVIVLLHVIVEVVVVVVFFNFVQRVQYCQ